MTLEQEFELSQYEVLAQLREEKEVYLVRHVDSGGLYIRKNVKVFNLDIYEKLQGLNLPSIPHIITYVQDGENLIVIEEYIHGKTLKELCQHQGTFSPDQAIGIIIKICDVLRPLHNCNPPIVHRDIKPSNIMVSNDGVVKLIDFNAAKEFSAEKSEDTVCMGTKEYASPEQYGFGQSDTRADIYALGVTLNYLLTGKVPKEQLYQGELMSVIQKCTQLDSKNRYQTVDELKEALVKKKSVKPQSDDLGISDRKNCYNDSVPQRKQYRFPWLPVGFRSFKAWKMLLAVFGYALIFNVCFTTTFHTNEGIPLTGRSAWVNRFGMLACCLVSVFFTGNYGGIRYRLPGMRGNKILHWILWAIYLFAAWLICLTVVVIFE